LYSSSLFPPQTIALQLLRHNIMSAAYEEAIIGAHSIEGKIVPVPSHAAINKVSHEKEELSRDDAGIEINEKGLADGGEEIKPVSDGDVDSIDNNKETGIINDDYIIVTGADASAHLLPLRDDFEPALTFRSIFLATCLSAFQAVMSQIYSVSLDIASIALMHTQT
jgi:hypothetical protein